MPDMTSLARWLVLAGLLLAGIGGLLWVVSRLGLPLGRLPGDFRFQAGGVTCFLPLASSILLSLLLTLVLNLIARRLK
jgi:hypothetical protein